MPNIIMPNIVAQVTPSKGPDPKAQVPVDKKGSFVQHLQRQVRAEKTARENVVGSRRKDNGITDKKVKEQEPPASVEALLQQVMRYLQKALDKPDSSAGQWSFQLQDVGILEKLAGQAGMDASALAILKKQMEQEGGLPLADLFAALEKSFEELGQATKVTASETYLPLLDSFLARLGVSPEAIKRVDGQGVNGVDQLDLAAYLQGLKTSQNQSKEGTDASSFILTDWEREQLSAMLAEAGVPSSTIDTMFPEVKTLEENALAGLREGQGDTLVSMTLDRLERLLQQAVAAVGDARPKANLPGFLDGLQQIMSQAGFQETGVGWSPVVQGTMQAVYDQLQAMVDLATVKVEKLASATERVGDSLDWQQMEGWSHFQEEKSAEARAENESLDQQWMSSGDESAPNVSGKAAGTISGASADSLAKVKSDSMAHWHSQPGIEAKGVDPGADPSVKFQPPRMRFAPELQQFAVEQISHGVLRGLRNNDHHLALTLYPKELGEVKVDLQVRGSHLSVSFVMENQKVKEAMEANMGDFKDNLERRGFTLGEMAVSIDQQNHSSDDQRQFAKAWSEMIETQVQDKKNLTQPGLIAEMTQAGQTQSLHGGISLFV